MLGKHGRRAEARRLCRRALALLEAALPAGDPRRRLAQRSVDALSER
jgi:hypothetical protein